MGSMEEKIKLREKHHQWLQALETLQNNIILYAKILNNPAKWGGDDGEEMALASRDSTIKRFEYCYELTWKYLQRYLIEDREIDDLDKGSRPIFRQTGFLSILTKDEVSKCLNMCDSRNMTSHIYKDEIADCISKGIPGYYELMIIIAEKTKAGAS